MSDYTPTAKEVQALRQATGAGILDARRALIECDGDQDKSTRWLREQGLAGASKRSERERAEGAVSVVVTGGGRLGGVLALECETDFVAKSAEFVQLVDTLAETLASEGEDALAKHDEEIDQLKVTLKENIAVGNHTRFEASPDAILDSYLHVQNGRGVNGVLVELAGATPELAHDVAIHIAFARPEYLRREDIPESVLAQERETIEATARNEGKPEEQLEKIVEGRLRGFVKERALLEQPYARDDKKSVAQILGDAQVLRFAQVVVGA
ncbi:MAG TPA: translation elongation factor Ts [Acidimicrobiales bacterium]|nr:translation elongation factor Ts [Acidimicrobiales bacterium]